jgi:HEPN domain-containing protein
MKPITAEWVAKAEGDFAIMEREGRVRKNPGYDGICFHAQQCAEKYLKARLCESDIEFGKTHDLVTLLDAVTPMERSWDAYRRDLAHLSVFAVAYRYPGDSATPVQAKDAIQRCRLLRKAVRQAMGLDAGLAP